MKIFASRFSVLFFFLLCLGLFGWNEMAFSEDNNNQMLNVIDTANQHTKQMRPGNDDLSCACSFNEVEGQIPYETEKTCNKERMYVNEIVKSFRDADTQQNFAVKRVPALTAHAEIPKKCIMFAMRDFIPTSETQASGSFASCDGKTGMPKMGSFKPCVTEDYVNLVYNSFIDVADCMGLPQKTMVPKLMNESGFHINSFGALREVGGKTVGGDAGIGQMTKAALVDAKENIDIPRNQILNSSKASCRRLATIPGAIPSADDIQTELQDRCNVILSPPNPIKSLIMYGVLYKNNVARVQNQWKVREMDTLMELGGAKDLSKDKMQESIQILSYNAGSTTSIVLYQNWVKYRAANAKKHPITKDDFDFSVPISEGIRNLSPEKAQEILTTEDPEKLAELSRLANVKKSEIEQLTFPQYLRVYRTGWAKGYVTYVKNFAKKLDEKFGKNVCTDASFLQDVSVKKN